MKSLKIQADEYIETAKQLSVGEYELYSGNRIPYYIKWWLVCAEIHKKRRVDGGNGSKYALDKIEFRLLQDFFDADEKLGNQLSMFIGQSFIEHHGGGEIYRLRLPIVNA